MSDTRSTRALIAAAIIALALSLFSTAHGQPYDSGPEAALDAGANLSDAAPVALDASIPEASEASPVNPAEADPTGTAVDVYKSLKAGQYLIAFGGALMLLVWFLRLLLMWLKVKWVSTKPGGFVLAFGTAFLLAIGTAWQAGEGISIGLFSATAVAAWAAAGKWGHFRDALDHLRGKS